MVSLASDDLPKTLDQWRRKGAHSREEEKFPRDMWDPLEPFFLSIGYTLWKKASYILTIEPPNDAPRKQDEYACRIPYNDLPENRYNFWMEVRPIIRCFLYIQNPDSGRRLRAPSIAPLGQPTIVMFSSASWLLAKTAARASAMHCPV